MFKAHFSDYYSTCRLADSIFGLEMTQHIKFRLHIHLNLHLYFQPFHALLVSDIDFVDYPAIPVLFNLSDLKCKFWLLPD